MKTLFDSMLKEGIIKERLNSVFTPIGLQINSRTPQEIAVSILAQITMLRRGGDGKPMRWVGDGEAMDSLAIIGKQ